MVSPYFHHRAPDVVADDWAQTIDLNMKFMHHGWEDGLRLVALVVAMQHLVVSAAARKVCILFLWLRHIPSSTREARMCLRTTEW